MAKQSRPGRPTVQATPGTRSTVSLRLTAETKAKLDAVAKERGRPFSHEAEMRLESSFDRQGLLVEVLKLSHRPKVAGLLLALGSLMEKVGSSSAYEIAASEERQPGDWTDEPYAVDQAIRSAIDFLERSRPADGRTTEHVRQDVTENLPLLVAGELARTIRGNAQSTWALGMFGEEKITEIKELLVEMGEGLGTDGPGMVPGPGALKKNSSK